MHTESLLDSQSRFKSRLSLSALLTCPVGESHICPSAFGHSVEQRKVKSSAFADVGGSITTAETLFSVKKN